MWALRWFYPDSTTYFPFKPTRVLQTSATASYRYQSTSRATWASFPQVWEAIETRRRQVYDVGFRHLAGMSDLVAPRALHATSQIFMHLWLQLQRYPAHLFFRLAPECRILQRRARSREIAWESIQGYASVSTSNTIHR